MYYSWGELNSKNILQSVFAIPVKYIKSLMSFVKAYYINKNTSRQEDRFQVYVFEYCFF